ncbi:hypothetical protein VDIAB_271022 [Vibrio diabolicus]|nr:hypothetical protein VDIAB_271022 [Vibrio diabolicus]
MLGLSGSMSSFIFSQSGDTALELNKQICAYCDLDQLDNSS